MKTSRRDIHTCLTGLGGMMVRPECLLVVFGSEWLCFEMVVGTLCGVLRNGYWRISLSLCCVGTTTKHDEVILSRRSAPRHFTWVTVRFGTGLHHAGHSCLRLSLLILVLLHYFHT